MIPVYQEEKDGIPGPLSHILGYDRDTGVASLLDIKAECYISWWWRPTRGEGGITRIVQVNARTYALYHESGYLRLEPQPDAWFCTPTIPPK